jgi:hypothetical protein
VVLDGWTASLVAMMATSATPALDVIVVQEKSNVVDVWNPNDDFV